MQRLPQTGPGLSGDRAMVANQEAAQQVVAGVTGSVPSASGGMMNLSSHMSALPAFAFVILMLSLMFYLFFHSHVSMAASLGVRK